MAGAAGGLTRDRITILSQELDEKYKNSPTIRRVIRSVLEPLAEGWANHEQGMTVESFAEVEQALNSPLQALEAVPVQQAGMACDQLAAAWDKVRDRIKWTG